MALGCVGVISCCALAMRLCGREHDGAGAGGAGVASAGDEEAGIQPGPKGSCDPSMDNSAMATTTPGTLIVETPQVLCETHQRQCC